MELQPVLYWAARLACPIALAVMLWLLLRSGQPAATPEPPAEQRLAELDTRLAALDLEIQALEARAGVVGPDEGQLSGAESFAR
jgi:hypothetical protein